MSDSEKRDVNTNATIQLDQIDGQLDAVRLDDEPSGASGDGRARKVPPPLPPGFAAPTASVPQATQAAPGATRSSSPGIGKVVVFLVLLVVAVAGGLKLGLRARGEPATPAASAPPGAASVAAATASAPAASASAGPQTITLPTVEMR